jgi:dimethylglycine dehydrogenase
MDISAFTKVEVSGPDAEALLDRLVANRLPQKPGGIALTHMLNRAAGSNGNHHRADGARPVLSGLRGLLRAAPDRPPDLQSRWRGRDIINRSSDWAAIAMQGPKARDILGACTDAALDNAAFRWLSAQEIEIAGHPVWALRMSYGGELGWELHGPREHLLAVYDALWAAGEAHGIADYGSFAMNALRMEKGFKGAGELTNEVTLPEADVMRFVKPDKGEFLGREATLAALAKPLPWVCAYLEIEPHGDWDGNGGEAVRWMARWWARPRR